jgi:hypothetical protein
MQKTLSQYNQIVTICRDIFEKKMKDYGTSWRILRSESVTDQIYIKAQRIQCIEKNKTQMIGDDIRSEFIGIVNYSIIGLIQLAADDGLPIKIEAAQAMALYDEAVDRVRDLMVAKNTDYSEAWRSMRISSLTDLILMKIFRIKQIEDNLGQTSVSEGIDANYMDMMNYAIFALIKTDHKE